MFECGAISQKQSLKQFEVEQRLSFVLQTIDEETKSSWGKIIYLAIAAFCEEGKKRPWATLAKSIISVAGLSAAYPAAIGSWACIKTLKVVPLGNLQSADYETAIAAAQGIGNAGMAVTYIVQMEEFVLHPISQLFIECYNKKVCEEILSIYNKVLLENRAFMSSEEIDFLIQKENGELSRYNGLAVGDTINIDEIQNEIDCEIKKRLSSRNIIHLMGRQIKDDIKNASKTETLVKVTKTAVAVGIVGVSSAILSIGTYGCYKPFDLQNPSELESSDPNKVQDAIANYANAGHGLEYVAVIGILGLKAIKSIVGNQYKAVMRKQIQAAYMSRIEDQPHPKEVSNLLHKRMHQKLALYV